MASDIWQWTIQIAREETCCRHMGYSFRLTARVILYAPSHRQDSTYHSLCYTSRGWTIGKYVYGGLKKCTARKCNRKSYFVPQGLNKWYTKYVQGGLKKCTARKLNRKSYFVLRGLNKWYTKYVQGGLKTFTARKLNRKSYFVLQGLNKWNTFFKIFIINLT